MHPYIREYLRRLRLLVWNEREQRPRAFLRIYLFLMAYTTVFVSIPILMAPTGTGLFRTAVLRGLLALYTVGLLVAAATVLDRRPVRMYGLRFDRQWVMDLVVGITIGGAIPVGVTLVGLAGGWLSASHPRYLLTASYLRDLSLAIVITTSIAVTEELVFRSYVLTNAIEGLNFPSLSRSIVIASALVSSASLFAIVHFVPAIVDGLHFLAAGLLLGLAYLLTGQAALPIGIHAGFNFASRYIVPRAPDTSIAIVPVTEHGPSWLVGQTGIVQTAFLLPSSLLILAYIKWRCGHIRVHQ